MRHGEKAFMWHAQKHKRVREFAYHQQNMKTSIPSMHEKYVKFVLTLENPAMRSFWSEISLQLNGNSLMSAIRCSELMKLETDDCCGWSWMAFSYIFFFTTLPWLQQFIVCVSVYSWSAKQFLFNLKAFQMYAHFKWWKSFFFENLSLSQPSEFTQTFHHENCHVLPTRRAHTLSVDWFLDFC